MNRKQLDNLQKENKETQINDTYKTLLPHTKKEQNKNKDKSSQNKKTYRFPVKLDAKEVL
jgi:hypothetical protein